MRAAIAALALSVAAGDYISVLTYIDSTCGGSPIGTSALYNGCSGFPGGSMKLECVNATAGNLVFYVGTSDCTGTGMPSPLNSPGTCNAGGNGTYSLQSCATGTYAPPTSGNYFMNVAFSLGGGNGTCSGDPFIYSSSVVGECITNPEADESALTTCNDSAVTQTLYGGAGCVGDVIDSRSLVYGCNETSNYLTYCVYNASASPSPAPGADSASATASGTGSASVTGTTTPTGTPSESAGASATSSGSASSSVSASPTASLSVGASESNTASASASISPSGAARPSDDNKASVGTIAGAVVGGVAGMAALAGAMFWVLRRRSEADRNSVGETSVINAARRR